MVMAMLLRFRRHRLLPHRCYALNFADGTKTAAANNTRINISISTKWMNTFVTKRGGAANLFPINKYIDKTWKCASTQFISVRTKNQALLLPSSYWAEHIRHSSNLVCSNFFPAFSSHPRFVFEQQCLFSQCAYNCLLINRSHFTAHTQPFNGQITIWFRSQKVLLPHSLSPSA